MSEPYMPGAIHTMGGRSNEEAVRSAIQRIANHDPAKLNAIAGAVTTVLGFKRFSDRYAIAVLALEALETATDVTEPTA